MSITASRRRVSAGVPTGGQFAANARPESGLGLTDLASATSSGCPRSKAHFDGCSCVGPTTSPDHEAQVARARDAAYESRAYARMVLSARVNTPMQALGFQVGDRISDQGRGMRVVSTPHFDSNGDVEFDVIDEFDRHAERPSTVTYDPDQHLTAVWLAPDVHKSARGADATMAGWVNPGDAIIDDEGTTRTVTSLREYDGPVGVRMSIEATDADGQPRVLDVDSYVGIARAH